MPGHGLRQQAGLSSPEEAVSDRGAGLSIRSSRHELAPACFFRGGSRHDLDLALFFRRSSRRELTLCGSDLSSRPRQRPSDRSGVGSGESRADTGGSLRLRCRRRRRLGGGGHEVEGCLARRLRQHRCSGSVSPKASGAAAATPSSARERLRRPCCLELTDRPFRPTQAALATCSGDCGGSAFTCTCSTTPVTGAAARAASRAAALATASAVLVEDVDSVELGFRERERKICRPKTVEATTGGGMALPQRRPRTAEANETSARAK